MEKGEKNAGMWLRLLVEAPPQFEVLRYLNVLKLVTCLYIMRVITKDTLNKFSGLSEVYLTYGDTPIGKNRERTKSILSEHWKDILGGAINALCYDQKISKELEEKSTLKLFSYLTGVELPRGLYCASYSSLLWLLDTTFYYDRIKKELLYVVEEDGEDRPIQVVKKTDLDESDDIALRRGENLFYGVTGIYYNEEKRNVYMTVPALCGVICYNFTLRFFLYNRSYIRDDTKNCGYSLRPGDEEGAYKGRIGGFDISEDGKIINQRVRKVYDGVYDFEDHRMKDPDAKNSQVTICYDSRSDRYICRMPENCGEVVLSLLETYHLSLSDIAYEFYTDDMKC